MRRASALLAALLGVLALTSCGGGAQSGGDAQASAPAPQGLDVAGAVGPVRAGSIAQLAQCSDWNEGTREQRLVTIGDIRNQLNQTGADGPTPDLSDEDAYSAIQNFCRQDFAVGFRLYKLYARAAAFAPLSQ